MDKQHHLQDLGAILSGKRTLAEDAAVAGRFDDFKRDLMIYLRSGAEVSVSISQKGADMFEYSFGKKVNEEAVEVKSASDVWTENKDSAQTYVSNKSYSVRKVPGEKYEVSTEEGTTRKIFATLSKADLDSSFTPTRPNQTPDAEGYTQYRDIDEREAFKSDGDTVKLEDDGGTMLLAKGDYLIRKTDGSTFSYEVKKAKDFDALYTKK